MNIINVDMVLHLDMDGVLTDFDKGFKQITGGIGPDDYRKSNGGSGEASIYLKDGRHFFENLDWIEGGQELLEFALKHYKIVRILSSAGTGKDKEKFKEVQAGKLSWIEKHIPQIEKKNIIIVPFSNLKASRHSGPNRILVDDKDKTIDQWIERGGIGILHTHTNWKNTIEKLQVHLSDPIKLKEIVGIL